MNFPPTVALEATNDFSTFLGIQLARMTVNPEFGQRKLDGGAVEHEPYFSVKEGPPRIRRDDDATEFSR